jgi:hypothetical protein
LASRVRANPGITDKKQTIMKINSNSGAAKCPPIKIYSQSIQKNRNAKKIMQEHRR